MQGSGINWYLNKTSLTNGNYTFKVYANDTANNWNSTEQRWVYINFTNQTQSYCGDGTCNNGETCSSCSQDCGTCPSGGSGSSGGGAIPVTNETNQTEENQTPTQPITPTTPTNKTSQTIKNQTNQTQPIEPINQSIIGEIKPEINQTSPAPLIPEQLVYPAIGLIIIGIISGLIYFRKSQIAELLTKLKPTDNLNKRVEKIEQKIYEMKLKGEDTTEIENELELIKKDLKIGLKSIAKIRLEKVERKLKIKY
jgi:hypothetical protein